MIGHLIETDKEIKDIILNTKDAQGVLPSVTQSGTKQNNYVRVGYKSAERK